jgi:uncharacterized protein YndB with AHSA1/START domain
MMPTTRLLRQLLLTLCLCSLSLAQAQERAVRKEILVPAPIEAVWKSWTTQEGIQSFFAPEAVIEARPGGAFHIHIDPYGQPGRKGADDMRFMALQAPKMLSFDWNAPPSMPEVRQHRSFVVVRLAEVDARTTRVTLHHSGWGDGGEWDKAYAYFDAAWGRVLANLRQRHEQGPIDWSAWLELLRKAHADAAAAKAAESK